MGSTIAECIIIASYDDHRVEYGCVIAMLLFHVKAILHSNIELCYVFLLHNAAYFLWANKNNVDPLWKYYYYE